LRNEAPMQLIVSGRIVRAGDDGMAVEMVQHEFRTMSTSPERGRQGSTTPLQSMLMSSGAGGLLFSKYR